MKILSVLLFLLFCVPALAADPEADDGKAASGLPLPRFASLRSNEVNLRTGPGTRYPIDWVYRHQGLPIEIVAEFEVWRRIRDWEGTEGWVHKSGLSGKREAIVTGTMRELYKKEDPQSPILAHLEPGATGLLLSCAHDWCRVKFDHIKGYLRKTDFWGARADEVFN